MRRYPWRRSLSRCPVCATGYADLPGRPPSRSPMKAAAKERRSLALYVLTRMHNLAREDKKALNRPRNLCQETR